MFQEEIAVLEEELEGYRAKLNETDERKIEFVFKPHSFRVKQDNELVRLGKMSVRRAEERRFISVRLALRGAERLDKDNKRVTREISNLRERLRARNEKNGILIVV